MIWLGRRKKPRERDIKHIQGDLTEYPTEPEGQEEFTGRDEETEKRRAEQVRKFLSSKKKKKPIRVVKLDPVDVSEKKEPERSKCPFCSGNLVLERGIKICKSCGKTPARGKPITDWGEKRKSVREEVRGGQRT